MRKYAIRSAAAVCACLMVVACFFPVTAHAASGDQPNTDWIVNIFNADGSKLFGDLVQIGIGALPEEAWSVRIFRDTLEFRYTDINGTFWYATPYVWQYPGTDALLSMTITINNRTLTFEPGEWCSPYMFVQDNPPYAHAMAPSSIYLETGIQKQEQTQKNWYDWIFDLLPNTISRTFKNYFDTIDGAFDVLFSTLALLPDDIAFYVGDYIGELLEPLAETVDTIERYIKTIPLSIYHLFFPDGSYEDLEGESGNVSGDMDDVKDFEDNYLGNVESGIADLTPQVNINFLTPAFAFIGGRVSRIYDGFGNFRVIFLLPVFIGILFILTRYNPRSLEVRVRRSDKGDN